MTNSMIKRYRLILDNYVFSNPTPTPFAIQKPSSNSNSTSTLTALPPTNATNNKTPPSTTHPPPTTALARTLPYNISITPRELELKPITAKEWSLILAHREKEDLAATRNKQSSPVPGDKAISTTLEDYMSSIE
jgi:hypothetical protein